MKALTTITLQGSHKLLRVGSIRSPAALPRMAVRGRAFLSERADDIRFRYYKGGQSREAACPRRRAEQEDVGPALTCHSASKTRVNALTAHPTSRCRRCVQQIQAPLLAPQPPGLLQA